MSSPPPTFWRGPYLCYVESSTAYVPVTPPDPAPSTYHRWTYELVPVDLSAQTNYLQMSLSAPAGGVSFAFQKSLNIAELQNTGTEIMGISTSQIPSGFSLEPIPDQTLVMAWVNAAPEDENEIGHLSLFYAMNQYSGTCSGFAP